MKNFYCCPAVVNMRFFKQISWSSRKLSKARGSWQWDDAIRWSDLINIGISEHRGDWLRKSTILLDLLSVQMMPFAAGIVDDFNAAGLKAFGPTKAAAELTQGFCKEIMVKYKFRQRPMAIFSDFEASQGLHEEKAAPNCRQGTAWPLGKVSRRCGDSWASRWSRSRDAFGHKLVIQVRV